MKASTGLTVLFLILAICGLGYWLISEIFTIEYPSGPKTAEAYEAPGSHSLNDAAVLNEKTHILGYAVYDQDGKALGTLYDVYAESQEGKILWLSVNIKHMTTDRPKAELILIPIARVQELEDDGPVVLNMDRGEFFDLPFQTTHEQQLVGLISLRSLPRNQVYAAGGPDIGRVQKVTYKSGYLDTVYFEASGNHFRGTDNQIFTIPFRYLHFDTRYDEFTGDAEIRLTERQAGAVQMYLQNEDALE